MCLERSLHHGGLKLAAQRRGRKARGAVRHTEMAHRERSRIPQGRREPHGSVHGRVAVGVEQTVDLVENRKLNHRRHCTTPPWHDRGLAMRLVAPGSILKRLRDSAISIDNQAVSAGACVSSAGFPDRGRRRPRYEVGEPVLFGDLAPEHHPVVVRGRDWHGETGRILQCRGARRYPAVPIGAMQHRGNTTTGQGGVAVVFGRSLGRGRRSPTIGVVEAEGLG
jgi:hypothetical protein